MNKTTIDLNKFLDYLYLAVQHYWIYIWGAQGQAVKDLLIGKIDVMETSATYLSNVFKHLSEVVKLDDWDLDQCRAVDCSGLGMYYLQNLTGYLTWDHNADALLKESVIIDAKYRQPGDFVFHSFDKKGKAGHIGYVADNDDVIESKGRLYGVICKKYADTKWTKVARPPYWAYKMTKKLKKGSKGDAVGQLQARLISFGYDCGSTGVDNDFGSKTEAALKAFQKAKKLEQTGIMDQETALKLLFVYG